MLVRDMEYAVIESGGKQYTVRPGETLEVERIASPGGGVLELDRVLLVSKDGQVRVGRPLVEGARVMAEVVDQGKGPKVVVFKYKSKVRYRRKRGHRQPYTRLRVGEIVIGEEAPSRREGGDVSGEGASDGS